MTERDDEFAGLGQWLDPGWVSPTSLISLSDWSRRQLLANAAIAASRVGS
jgi:hypothetical protein